MAEIVTIVSGVVAPQRLAGVAGATPAMQVG